MTMTTAEKLGRYAFLMNRFGADSDEADEFLGEHRFDSEFLELAELSRRVKVAFRFG